MRLSSKPRDVMGASLGTEKMCLTSTGGQSF